MRWPGIRYSERQNESEIYHRGGIVMTLGQAFEDYIVEQQLRGNSVHTIEYYKNCLNPFIDFYGFESDIRKFDKSKLNEYALFLRNRGLASNSVKTYTKGIRAFLSWLHEEERTEKNLSLDFKLPKAKRKTIAVLSDDEVKCLFEYFNLNTYFGLRNYCICMLMFDSGLRKSEVVRLCPEDLYMDENYIVVNGKGAKQRIVPIGQKSKEFLLRYLLQRPRVKGGLFLTQKNTPITVCVIERLFKTLKEDLQIPRIHAHLLRHSFATRYLENGGGLEDLQYIMGHADLDMVLVYVHLVRSRQIVKSALHSPMDNLTA